MPFFIVDFLKAGGQLFWDAEYGQVVVEMIFVAHAGPNSGYQLQTPSQESIVHLTTESYDLSWNACRRLSNCSHDNNRYPVSPSFGDHDFLMGQF